MALDSSIILRASDALNKMPNYGEVMEQRAAIQARQQALAEHNAAYEQAQQARAKATATEQLRVSAGQMAAGGDSAGARKRVLAAGDFEMAAKLDSMGDAERNRVFEVSQRTAPLVLSLRGVPAEATAGAMQSLAPQLQAAGWTPQHIAEVAQQLSDSGTREQAFDMIEGSAMTIADYRDKQKQDYTREKDTLDRGVTREGNYVSAGYLPPDGISGEQTAGEPADAGDMLGRMTGITAQSESGNRERLANGNLVTSPAGAQGKMQVMPGTNRSPGFGVRPAADGSDAERTRVGQDYLKAMVQRYGDPAKAWAAYNAGPGRVDQAIKIAGQNWMSVLPAETRAYVKRNVSQLGGSAQAARAPGGLRPIPGGSKDPNKPSDRQQWRNMSAAEAKAEGLPEGVLYQRSSDGEIKPVSGQEAKQTNLKMAPNKSVVDYQENLSSLRGVDQALKLLDPKNNSTEAKNARKAIGFGTGALGSSFSQYNDPEGNAFRALIGRIGGIIIKDTSGAAVSASEDARLAQWVPKPTDTPAAAMAKLKNLKNAIANFQAGFDDIYNEDNGYRPLRVRSQGAPGGNVPTLTPQQYKNAPSGTRFRTTDGKLMVKP